MTANNFKDTRLYRSRDGVILGICRGIADNYDIPAFWLRIGVIFIALTTAIWPVILAYFALAFFMKPRPVLPLTTEGENEFYNSYTSSRSMALNRLKRKFDNLNNRIHRMEDVVTSKEYRWNQNFPEDTTSPESKLN